MLLIDCEVHWTAEVEEAIDSAVSWTSPVAATTGNASTAKTQGPEMS